MTAALAVRVQGALERPPLSKISAAARAELAELVAVADELEDLPGKWQAAILRAEAAGGEDSAGCCGGGSTWSL